VRVANAAGMLVFFPMFILGGGGPPAGVMPAGMRDIADLLPLGRVTDGLRAAWLYDQAPWTQAWWLLGWWAVALVLVSLATRMRRRP
jgi:ABC-2 type transport system permease protein